MDLPDAYITVSPVVRVGLLVDGAGEVTSNSVGRVFNDGAGEAPSNSVGKVFGDGAGELPSNSVGGVFDNGLDVGEVFVVKSSFVCPVLGVVAWNAATKFEGVILSC